MNPETILQKLTQRIREEFEEAPGLTLTVPEAARFWDLDEMTCRQVLGRLRAVGFLVRDGERRYHQVSEAIASHAEKADSADLVDFRVPDRLSADAEAPSTRRHR